MPTSVWMVDCLEGSLLSCIFGSLLALETLGLILPSPYVKGLLNLPVA